MCVCARVCVFACLCMCVCVRVCVCITIAAAFMHVLYRHTDMIHSFMEYSVQEIRGSLLWKRTHYFEVTCPLGVQDAPELSV